MLLSSSHRRLLSPVRPRGSTALAPFVLAAGLTGCEIADGAREAEEPIGLARAEQSVSQAVQSSCSTEAVQGLSAQIIAQAACINPDAFVEVPDLGNITFNGNVNPFLEKPARDALVKALNDNPNKQLGINSMLRTVAQQYLLYRWYKSNTCGIGLAATPGTSNHESGLALDTSNYDAWKSILQANGFKWLGSSDPVHFDYVGPGAVDHRGVDVLAFQQLWNKNHPDDAISADGEWGPETESRMAQSPAEGFGMPVVCEAAAPESPDVWLSADVVGGEDLYADGASLGVSDTFEGETSTLAFRLVNQGAGHASKVLIGVESDGDYLEISDYLIESDWMNEGVFTENDANTLEVNPSHGDLGPSFTLDLNALSQGETKRITLTVKASRYSVDHESPAGVRVFVKEIPEHYTGSTFGGEVTNVDDAQIFNGGRLEIASALDVFSRTRWEWDSNRLEGFTASNAAPDEDGPLFVDGGALTFEGVDASAYVLSPLLPELDDTTLRLRARRSGGSGRATLAVVGASEGGAEGDEVVLGASVDLELPADGSYRDIEIDLRATGITGPISRFAIVPFDGGVTPGQGGRLEIDSMTLGDDGGPEAGPPELGGNIHGSCACTIGEDVDARGRRGAIAAVCAGLIGALALARTRRGIARRRSSSER